MNDDDLTMHEQEMAEGLSSARMLGLCLVGVFMVSVGIGAVVWRVLT